MQRIFDLILSGLCLLLLSPLLLPLIIILRFTGEGEVFYRQSRIGLGSQKFFMYKFATMLKNSPNIGAGTLTMQNDPRVLFIGSFLRKTKINELPQLFNIFIGDMSIVGPRPLLPEGDANYKEEESILIRSVLPGLTGIGSLLLRDEESYYARRSDPHDFYKHTISPYKASLEVWYVENKSIWLYIKIIIVTGIAILLPSLKVEGFFSRLPQMPQSMIDSKI